LNILPAYDHNPASRIIHDRQYASAAFHGTAWLVDVKRIKTREKKETMVFLTFEDTEDTFEVVLFPEMYKTYAELIRQYRFFEIRGTINVEGGNVAVIAESLSPAATGLDEKPYL